MLLEMHGKFDGLKMTQPKPFLLPRLEPIQCCLQVQCTRAPTYGGWQMLQKVSTLPHEHVLHMTQRCESAGLLTRRLSKPEMSALADAT